MKPLNVVLCGGGARNSALRRELAARLPDARVGTIDAFGIPPEAKEPLSFAMLAWAAIRRLPSNLCQATGARRPACLGVRFKPP